MSARPHDRTADSRLGMPPRPLLRILLAVLVIAVLGGCSHSGRLLTKGTMPPPGPDGMVDPSSAPDFIAVAGREDGIAGWVAKSYVFPTERVVKGRPGALPPADPPEPVYADDLRTVVGYLVVGEGFVPLVDHPIAESTAGPLRAHTPEATPVPGSFPTSAPVAP